MPWIHDDELTSLMSNVDEGFRLTWTDDVTYLLKSGQPKQEVAPIFICASPHVLLLLSAFQISRVHLNIALLYFNGTASVDI